MRIKRVEVTFNQDETEILEYLEKQPVNNATFLKQLIREHMSNIHSIDYSKIEQIMKSVLNDVQFAHTTVSNHTSPIPKPKINPLLNGIGLKY